MGTPLTVGRFEPAEFQIEDLAYLERNNVGANWGEMGTYKTTTGLWLAERKLRHLTNPAVLFITTKMGKGPYYDAVPKTLPSWNLINVETNKINQLYFGKYAEQIDGQAFVDLVTGEVPTIVLAHYHCFTNRAKMKDLLYAVEWDGVVIDEAHRIKDKDAQWTRNIKQLKINDAGFKHVMTGTGFVNRPDELWSLLHFLDRRTWPSYWNFRKEFCAIEVDEYGFEHIVGVKQDAKPEFRELRKALGPRRTLAEVRPDIAEPITSSIVVDLNATQRKMYDEIRDILYTLDQQGVPIQSPNVLSQLNRLRQICVATPEKIEDRFDVKLQRRVQVIKLVEPSSKLDAVMELLANLEWDEEDRQKIVVFSQFKDPLELLERRFINTEIPYLRLLQKHSESERYRIWHDLWPKPEYRVFLSTLDLGAESINLTANPDNLPNDTPGLWPCHRAVFLDRSWSPRANNQAVGRVYRPGQTGQAQMIYINADNTTDQRIEETNRIKTSWFNEIFGDDE